MKRQMPDGSYRWLGRGRAHPRGESLGQGYVPPGMALAGQAKGFEGRKLQRKGAT